MGSGLWAIQNLEWINFVCSPARPRPSLDWYILLRWRERSSWTTTAASVPASTWTPTSTWWWGRPGNSELFYNCCSHQVSVFCPYTIRAVQCAYLMCQFVWLSSPQTDRPIYIVIFNLLICIYLIDSSLYNYQHLGISSATLPSNSGSEIILMESLRYCHNLFCILTTLC